MIDVEGNILHLDQKVMAGERAKARRGMPLYELYRYVRPQRVWFLAVFSSDISGIDFGHFGHKYGAALCTLALN